MKSKSGILALLLVLAASGSSVQAAIIGATVDKLSGNAYVVNSAGKSTKLKVGEAIPAGSSVHTDDASSLGLKLVPGATAVLAPGTEIKLTTLDYSETANGAKARKIRLTLNHGTMVCSLAKHDGNSSYEVVTRDGVVAAHGTVWEVSFSPSAGVTVATANGIVTITLPGGQVVEVPGGKVTTSPDGVKTVTGTLTQEQVDTIVAALDGGGSGGGGGTFVINPVSSNTNPQNISNQDTISPN